MSKQIFDLIRSARQCLGTACTNLNIYPDDEAEVEAARAMWLHMEGPKVLSALEQLASGVPLDKIDLDHVVFVTLPDEKEGDALRP